MQASQVLNVPPISPPALYARPEPSSLEFDKVLQSILARTASPLTSTTVSVQVFGVFALPDAWKAKVTRGMQYRVRLQRKTQTDMK